MPHYKATVTKLQVDNNESKCNVRVTKAYQSVDNIYRYGIPEIQKGIPVKVEVYLNFISGTPLQITLHNIEYLTNTVTIEKEVNPPKIYIVFYRVKSINRHNFTVPDGPNTCESDIYMQVKISEPKVHPSYFTSKEEAEKFVNCFSDAVKKINPNLEIVNVEYKCFHGGTVENN